MDFVVIWALFQLGFLVAIVLMVVGAIYKKGARDFCRSQFTKDEWWKEFSPMDRDMLKNGSMSIKAGHRLLKKQEYQRKHGVWPGTDEEQEEHFRKYGEYPSNAVPSNKVELSEMFLCWW